MPRRDSWPTILIPLQTIRAWLVEALRIEIFSFSSAPRSPRHPKPSTFRIWGLFAITRAVSVRSSEIAKECCALATALSPAQLRKVLLTFDPRPPDDQISDPLGIPRGLWVRFPGSAGASSAAHDNRKRCSRFGARFAAAVPWSAAATLVPLIPRRRPAYLD